MKNRSLWLPASAAFAAACCALLSAQQGGRNSKRGPESEIFHTAVPDHPYDVILARPTDRSVTASILAYGEMEGFVEYGAAGRYTGKTATSRFPKGEPVQAVLQGLEPDRRYWYRLRHRAPGGAEFAASPEWTFHTRRAPGASFSFAVQADSHLDENAAPEAYRVTIENIAAGKPDFLIDLGDTFMTDKRRTDFKQAFPQYVAQRYWFGLVGRSAPVFLALGNHDGEGGARREMAAWSLDLRRRYFPNPRPDGFYTGNETPDPALGPLENYYAWEWGSALFIVLDPYWPTTGRARDDNWSWTLGDPQYRWLGRTLAASRAPLRFVFIHHPTGGKGQPIRGDAEAAKYNEWGGLNPDGSDGFRSHRPGWEMPVHQLLAKHKVAVVFHGHDHIFAKEDLDGVVYQLVPQPGHTRGGEPRNAREYGYVHGDVLGGSGYMRVTVGSDAAAVEFIRSSMPGAEGGVRNGAAAYSYRVGAGAANQPAR